MTAMDAIPVLLIVWAAILACFLGLLAYKGQLTRYEEDQLFLNDNVSHEQQFQTEIIRKVTKIQPFVRVFGVATAIMTAGIIGIFSHGAMPDDVARANMELFAREVLPSLSALDVGNAPAGASLAAL